MAADTTLALVIKADGSVAVRALNDVEGALLGAKKVTKDTSDGLAALQNEVLKMTAAFTAANIATQAFNAALSGLREVVNYARDAALMAARYETLGVTLQVVGRNGGYSVSQLKALETQLRTTGITATEARESLTRMAQANINLNLAPALARVAQDSAVIGGINSSEAFQRMIYGIQSAQVEVLRTIGLNVNFESSYKSLATQLKVSSEALTETEKANARANEVMKAGILISGAYEAAMGTAGKQMASLARYQSDLKVALGETFQEGLIAAVQAYTDVLKGAGTEAEKMQKAGDLREWGRVGVLVFAQLADGVRDFWAVLQTGVETSGLLFLRTMQATSKLNVFRYIGPQSVRDSFKAADEFVDAFGNRVEEDFKARWGKGWSPMTTALLADQKNNDQTKEGAVVGQREDDNWGAVTRSMGILTPAQMAKARSEADAQAGEIAKAVRTPGQVYADEMSRLRRVLKESSLTPEEQSKLVGMANIHYGKTVMDQQYREQIAQLEGSQTRIKAAEATELALIEAANKAKTISYQDYFNGVNKIEYDALVARAASVQREIEISEKAAKRDPSKAGDVQRYRAELDTIVADMEKAETKRTTGIIASDKKTNDVLLDMQAQRLQKQGNTEQAFADEFWKKYADAYTDAMNAGRFDVTAAITESLIAGLRGAKFNDIKREYDALWQKMTEQMDAAKAKGDESGLLVGALGAAEAVSSIRQQFIPELNALIERMNAVAQDNPVLLAQIAKMGAQTRKASEEVLPIWRDTVNKIDGTFHDGFVRMLEKGKTDWKAFADSLKNTFKTVVADFVYQAFARPLVLQVIAAGAGALGLSGAAQAATTMAGAGNAAFGGINFMNMGSTFANSGLYSSAATSSIGQALGLSNLVEVAPAIGEMGVGLSSLGTALGTAIPYVGAALAAASALGLFGGGGGPKASAAWLQQNAGGQFNVGMNDVAGGVDMSQILAINAALQDPAQYDQTKLQGLLGRQFSTGAPADTAALLGLLSQALTDAATAAKATTAATAAATAAQKGWQDQLDVLTGAKTQAQIDQTNALAGVTDETTISLINQVFAQRKLNDAAAAAAAALSAAQTDLNSLAEHYALKVTPEQAVSRLNEAFGTNFDLATLIGIGPDALKNMAQDAIVVVDPATAAGQKLIAKFKEFAPVFDIVVEAATEAEKGLAANRVSANDAVASSVASARNAVWQAYDREAGALQTLADKMRGLGQSLKDLQASLLLGADSPLNPMDKFAEAQRQFRLTASKAKLGDADALGALSGASQSYLAAGRASYASSDAYTTIFGEVQAALGASATTAGNAASAADRDKQALQGHADALVGARQATLSFSDSLLQFSTLIGQQMVQLKTGPYTASSALKDAQAGIAGGNIRGVYDKLIANGITASQFDTFMGYSSGTSNAWARSMNLPSFDVGTPFVPYDMTAQIHRGERIIPAASNDDLVSEVKALRASNEAMVGELRALRADVRTGDAINAAATHGVSRTMGDVAHRAEIKTKAERYA